MVCKKTAVKKSRRAQNSALTAAHLFSRSRRQHTADRIISSPPQQQYQQYDQSYQHYNPYNQPGQADNSAPVTSVGKYILWLILSTIPTAGFIIMIVFALDKTDKKTGLISARRC